MFAAWTAHHLAAWTAHHPSNPSKGGTLHCNVDERGLLRLPRPGPLQSMIIVKNSPHVTVNTTLVFSRSEVRDCFRSAFYEYSYGSVINLTMTVLFTAWNMPDYYPTRRFDECTSL